MFYFWFDTRWPRRYSEISPQTVPCHFCPQMWSHLGVSLMFYSRNCCSSLEVAQPWPQHSVRTLLNRTKTSWGGQEGWTVVVTVVEVDNGQLVKLLSLTMELNVYKIIVVFIIGFLVSKKEMVEGLHTVWSDKWCPLSVSRPYDGLCRILVLSVRRQHKRSSPVHCWCKFTAFAVSGYVHAWAHAFMRASMCGTSRHRSSNICSENP